MAATKTREKLVDVARQLFAKQGLENTTMNDIAVTSGKGRRTLYTYFKNKEEIYWAVIEGELERLSERMNEVAKQNMEPEDKLVEIVYTHLNMIKEAVQRNGNLRAEFFRNIIMVEKVRKNFDQTELKLFNAIMTEGVHSGKFEIDSIPLCANILHFSVKGLEIPYIYGRLAQGLPSGMSRGIVQKLIHKALGKPDRQHISYYL
ncbi:MAG: TetR/AcrR family transcriptional regulator [Bacteroidaceae bacterium]